MPMFNELLAEIESIPAIDIHSHIRAVSPTASDLSDIVLYHYIQTELKSAGVPRKLFEAEGPGGVKEIAKHLDRIQNTSTYWCLSQILDDLYEVGASPLAVDMDDLAARVARTAADQGWAGTVLDRARISKVLLTCEWHRPIPRATDRFVPTLRVDSLIGEPFMSRTLDKLTEVTEQSIYEAGELKKAISELFSKAASAGAVAASASFNPQIDFEEGSRATADRILSLVLLGQKTNRDDRKALRSFVMDCVLSSCSDNGIPFQLMLGVRRPMPGEVTISQFEPGMLAGYVELFARYPGVRFDVFVANETLAHELAVVARNYRNVYASGYWWYLMFPTHIRKMIRERVEMLPINKSNGFFSDAYCVEWAYGKSRLVRRELALALSQMVDEGYLSQNTALEVARHYLSENPKSFYGIE